MSAVGDRCEAWDGRDDRFSTGGEQKASSLEDLSIHLDALGVDELGRAVEHEHAPLAEDLGCFGCVDSINGGVDPRQHCAEIDGRIFGRQSEPIGPPHVVGKPSRLEQRLTRDASSPRAVATNPVAFNESNSGAQPGGEIGGGEPGRTGADDHQVISLGQTATSLRPVFVNEAQPSATSIFLRSNPKRTASSMRMTGVLFPSVGCLSGRIDKPFGKDCRPGHNRAALRMAWRRYPDKTDPGSQLASLPLRSWVLGRLTETTSHPAIKDVRTIFPMSAAEKSPVLSRLCAATLSYRLHARMLDVDQEMEEVCT